VVAAPTPFGMHNQGMAVRKDWPVVAGLLDKGLATMTTDERIRIDEKWGVIEFKEQIDYTLVWEILAAAAFILLVFLYWNRKTRRGNRPQKARRGCR
jgi:two-component system sensor histidine kinase/response regulator